MSFDEHQAAALPRERPPTPTAEPDALKLINVGMSADGRYVDVHFLTTANRVTSVRLDATVATGLYNLLGDMIGRIRAGLPQLRSTQLN